MNLTLGYHVGVDPTRTLTMQRERAPDDEQHSPSGPPLCVRVARGDNVVDIRLDERVTVGRLGSADIVIDAPTVSRLHVLLTRSGRGAVVQDCESYNGTTVAREGVRHALPKGGSMLLSVGDVVEVGGVALALIEARRRDDVMRSTPGVAFERALAQAAKTSLPVVLFGPSGSGKTHAARTLHELAGVDGAFVSINCARLPSDPLALQSELLGHKKGAFTGAQTDRVGRLEHANGGTVFFDEVESMPPLAQGFLLDILEGSGEAVPLGGGPKDALRVKFRVISASKQPLSSAALRRDLSERLAEGHLLVVPSLEERREDIPALLARFADEQSALLGRAVRLREECVRAMTQAAWPGHIRQLRGALMTMAQVAAASTTGAIDLDVAHFIDWQKTRAAVFDGTGGVSGAPASTSAPVGDTARMLKREDIMAALEACNGNQAAAARKLGIARNTLLKRLKQFDIPADHGALPRTR